MNGCGCAQAIRTNNHVFVPSLEPDEDGLGTIKAIGTAGGIPYQDSNRARLFVAKIQVERPKKKRKKEKGKGKQGAIGDRHLNK